MMLRRHISELQQDPANVRKHGPENLAAIKASLTRFGQQKPIVVNEKGIVVAGNGTLAAAKELGWVELDCVTTSLAGVEAVAYAIADNRTAELATWDEGALASTLVAMKADDEAILRAVGFSDVAFNKLLASVGKEAKQDEVPPVPANPVTKRGDVIVLGSHRLMCGDATVADDVHKAIGEHKPFLMVTDPPYGVNYDPSWRNDEGLSASERTGTVTNDNRVDWSEAYKLFLGEVVYLWHAGRFAGEVLMHLADTGFEVRAQIIWRKSRFAISRGHYHWQHEPCWYAVRVAKTSKWVGDRTQSTVWDIDSTNQDETNHSTQKPVEAMARPIRNHGGPEDVVYDPFLGSGTTLIAAQQVGRTCVGLEIEPAYCDVIVQRWENLTKQKAIRP